MLNLSTTALRVTAVCFALAALGCDDSKTKAAADVASAPAAGEKATEKPAEVDPLVAEAIAANIKDIAEVRAGLAKGSMAESMVCSDIVRRLETLQATDAALAKESRLVCDYERPLSELKTTIAMIETEAAEQAKRPNPHGLKRVISGCSTSAAKDARESFARVDKQDDSEAKAQLARFDALCPS